jgi:hypothetical protein
MTDYTKLIAELRNCANGKCYKCSRKDEEFCSTTSEIKKRYLDAADAIEELQAQIPKRGEWIMCESEKPYIVCKCSVCGGLTSECGHYCPNCGARMKGANDGC